VGSSIGVRKRLEEKKCGSTFHVLNQAKAANMPEGGGFLLF
jgi:hypothetical protein